jgi:hypothetical protein
LSGLKTKTINISEQTRNNTDQRNNAEFNEQSQDNNSSTISINDLRDLQNDGNVPKKTRRKPKSDRNTVSLDI